MPLYGIIPSYEMYHTEEKMEGEYFTDSKVDHHDIYTI